MTVSLDMPVSNSSASFASVTHLDGLVARTGKFLFTSPQTCIVNYSEDAWSHELPALGLQGYGKTEQESLANLAGDLAACWSEIAQANDNDLTTDARIFKARLLSAVTAA